MKLFVTQEACIETLRAAFMNRRKAFLFEFAVGLAVFFGERSADMHAKKVLRALYKEVGYDCLARTGRDYEMIGKRIDPVSDLYEKIGRKRVLAWSAGKIDGAAIEAIAAEIEKLELYTVKDVTMYCMGSREPVTRHREPPAHDRRAEDREYMFLVETEHLHVGIPPEATADELVIAANRLLELAEEMQRKAA